MFSKQEREKEEEEEKKSSVSANTDNAEQSSGPALQLVLAIGKLKDSQTTYNQLRAVITPSKALEGAWETGKTSISSAGLAITSATWPAVSYFFAASAAIIALGDCSYGTVQDYRKFKKDLEELKTILLSQSLGALSQDDEIENSVTWREWADCNKAILGLKGVGVGLTVAALAVYTFLFWSPAANQEGNKESYSIAANLLAGLLLVLLPFFSGMLAYFPLTSRDKEMEHQIKQALIHKGKSICRNINELGVDTLTEENHLEKDSQDSNRLKTFVENLEERLNHEQDKHNAYKTSKDIMKKFLSYQNLKKAIKASDGNAIIFEEAIIRVDSTENGAQKAKEAQETYVLAYQIADKAYKKFAADFSTILVEDQTKLSRYSEKVESKWKKAKSKWATNLVMFSAPFESETVADDPRVDSVEGEVCIEDDKTGVVVCLQ